MVICMIVVVCIVLVVLYGGLCGCWVYHGVCIECLEVWCWCNGLCMRCMSCNIISCCLVLILDASSVVYWYGILGMM